MGKFIPTKFCIYLDQFAISNLSENDTWTEILFLIKKGIITQKIFIPYSMEHLIESSHKHFEKAKQADKLLFEMSNGFSLEIENIVNAKLLICAIRKRPITISTYGSRVKINVFENENKFNDFRELKEIYNKMVEEGTSFVNELRSIIRLNQNQDLSRLNNSVLQTAYKYQQEVETRLKKFSHYGFFERKTITFSMMTIPFWADTLLDCLINNFNLTKKEAKKGQEILKQYGVKRILPPLYVRTALETILAVKQQKETVNDHMDIMRLCSAIPLADIILTDKSKVYDIKILGLDLEFKTEVYSGNLKGLANFRDRLLEIVN